MAVLVDTNILLRIAQPSHPQAYTAMEALNLLRQRNEALHITQQNIVEFWAVATRPIVLNGLGLNTELAMAKVEALKTLFGLLPELPLQREWEHLVVHYRVSGKNCHDARLVAAMMVHRVSVILTFNGQDFARYAGIAVLDPAKVS